MCFYRKWLILLPYTYDGVYNTPLGRFSKLDCSPTKTVPIANENSSGSSRRDASYADIFGTDTVPDAEISSMANRPGGVRYTPSYTVTIPSSEKHFFFPFLIPLPRQT